MKKCEFQMPNVGILDFGVLNARIEDDFEHIEVEYHYNKIKDNGVLRMECDAAHAREFVEAVRLLFVLICKGEE